MANEKEEFIITEFEMIDKEAFIRLMEKRLGLLPEYGKKLYESLDAEITALHRDNPFGFERNQRYRVETRLSHWDGHLGFKHTEEYQTYSKTPLGTLSVCKVFNPVTDDTEFVQRKETLSNKEETEE